MKTIEILQDFEKELMKIEYINKKVKPAFFMGIGILFLLILLYAS